MLDSVASHSGLPGGAEGRRVPHDHRDSDGYSGCDRVACPCQAAGAAARACPHSGARAALSLRLRPAEIGDLPALAEILNDEIRSGTASWTETPKSADDMRRWLAERSALRMPVLVAEADGQVLGYASYGPFRRGEGYRLTVEHSVYVARRARRRGIARALMERLIAEARAGGLHRMVGGVSADQPGSLALHRGLGFVEAGRLDQVGRKHGRWLDLVLMQLDLDAPAGQ